MPDDNLVVYTVKELLTRLDERIGQLDSKLDLRLVQMDERITHVERVQSERQHLIGEHREMRKDVDGLLAFRARFLPIGLVTALLAFIALALDLYIRLTS